jgi:hypothetical protein
MFMLHNIFFVLFFSFWHPIHISVSNLDYNPESKSLEITHKLFIDDFEKFLEKKHDVTLKIGTAKEHTDTDKYIQEYIQEKIIFTINNKTISPNFVGREQDTQSIWLYFEVTNLKKIKTFHLENYLLLDYFDDQSNIVHLKYLNKKESVRFNSKKTKKTLKF